MKANERAEGLEVSDPLIGSLKRRLLSGGMWAVSGRAVAALTGLASNALLARLLTPQDFGAYFLAFSFVSFGVLVGALGLGELSVRLLAENLALSRPDRVKRIVKIVCVWGFVGAVAVGGAYLVIGQNLAERIFGSSELAAVTALVAGWMVLMSLHNLMAEIFRGFHDIRLASIFKRLLSTSLLTLCLAVLIFFRNQISLEFVILLALLSSLASILLGGLLLRRKVDSLPTLEPRESKANSLGMFRAAWPLLITSLVIFILNQADLWIVGAFSGQENVALYGAAVRLVIMVVIPLQIVNLIVPPVIAEMHSQGRTNALERTLRIAATLTAIPAAIVLVAFIVFGGQILSVVFGSYYQAAGLILALLSLGHLVNVWVGACGQTLMMTGNQNTMMVITVFSGLVFVVGGLFAVREYGVVGVATVTAGSQMLQNILMLLAARAKVGVWTHVGFRVPLMYIKNARQGD